MSTQQIEHVPAAIPEAVPPAEPDVPMPRFIACTLFTGEVAYDPPLDSRQGRPFANWAQSRLTWARTIIELPPEESAP